MALRPRPYQEAALQAIKTKLQFGINRQLLKLPTGMGKTVVFASLPDYLQFKKRSMYLVHRDELAKQAQDKLRKWNPNRTVGIEMGDYSCGNADLVVGSVQTLGMKGSSRLKQFVPSDFDAVVIDEAHHAAGSTYRSVLDHFNLYQDSHRLSLGVTATPNRADGKGLGDIYQSIVFDYSLLDGIKEGWLSDLRGVKISAASSLDDVKTLGGDFNVGQLGDAVNTRARNDLIVRAWLQHGKDRKTVVFCVDIQHSKDLADVFKEYGVAAEAIWGTDPDRAEKLKYHREGGLKVITNCQILTEGYDDWSIGCIVLARPTKSESLYTQMVGRGTRIPDDIQNLLEARKAGTTIAKEDCILIDVVDVTSRHSLVSLPSLFGVNAGLDLKGKKISDVLQELEELQKAKPGIDLNKVQDATQFHSYAEAVDLFRITFSPEIVQFSEFQWFKTGVDAYTLRLSNNDKVCVSRDMLDKWHVSGEILTQKLINSFPGFPEAIRWADDEVRKKAGKSILTLIKREMKWHNNPPSPAQLNTLRRFKIAIPPGATSGDCAKRISELFGKLKEEREHRRAG